MSMSLTALAFQHTRLVLFLVVVVTLAGLAAYGEFPSQEEPSFLMREALIAVQNPGLSLKRMETSVARPLEDRVRALVEVKHVIVTVRDGAAFAQVQLHDTVRDPAPEGGSFGKLFVNVHRVVIATEPSVSDDVRFRHGSAG